MFISSFWLSLTLWLLSSLILGLTNTYRLHRYFGGDAKEMVKDSMTLPTWSMNTIIGSLSIFVWFNPYVFSLWMIGFGLSLVVFLRNRE